MTRLVALAGESRSGKGTVASVFRKEAEAVGLTAFERQLSDNGRWSLARIFWPTIRRYDAMVRWEYYKRDDTRVFLEGYGRGPIAEVKLQQFLQHGLQEGHRDIFGEDFWLDMILPDDVWVETFSPSLPSKVGAVYGHPAWTETFFDEESGVGRADLAIISDLRQGNEARRVSDLHGVVIELQRPHASDQYRTGSGHITECQLPRDLVHRVIVNDGTIDELKDKARTIFAELASWIHEGIEVKQ